MANKKRLISLELWEEFKNEVTKDLAQYDHYDTGYGDAIDRVDDWLFNQPEVDAVEVVHGRWIPIEYDGFADGNPVWDLWECSECLEVHSGDEDTLTPYCPNCGAKMDGERREEE